MQCIYGPCYAVGVEIVTSVVAPMIRSVTVATAGGNNPVGVCYACTGDVAKLWEMAPASGVRSGREFCICMESGKTESWDGTILGLGFFFCFVEDK